jgi:molybdopterin/thiamine biosynthesis adenylyltransferase
MKHDLILMPAEAARLIAESGVDWGHLGLAHNAVDHVYNVLTWNKKDGPSSQLKASWARHESLSWMKGISGQCLWYRGTEALHDRAASDTSRSQPTPVDFMREQVGGNWLTFKAGVAVVTFCEREGRIEWAAWLREGEGVFRPIDLEIYEPEADLLAPLDIAWPRQAIAEKLVTVIGLGSIGGAAAEAMASYGLRNFAFVDPDRLEGHNFARHRAMPGLHGKYKVDAVADSLEGRDPQVDVERVVAHVGHEADLIRPLLNESEIVACFTDGPESRRIAAHLSFIAHRPVVLGCVLSFGAYGEVLRLIPGKTGCLECNRRALADSLNLEYDLEANSLEERITGRDHGEHIGVSRRLGHYAFDPKVINTTAVSGDLHLVGALAAKVVVATLLTKVGYREQRLAGNHALLGLRPPLDPAPPPFDRVDRVAMTIWLPTAAPDWECPTCGPNGTR